MGMGDISLNNENGKIKGRINFLRYNLVHKNFQLKIWNIESSIIYRSILSINLISKSEVADPFAFKTRIAFISLFFFNFFFDDSSIFLGDK